MAVKKCSKCGQEKPATVEYFYKQKGCAGGLRPDCKTCVSRRVLKDHHARPEHHKARLKEYRAKHLEAHRAASKAWRKENRARHIANAVAWQKANRQKVYAHQHNWRAAKRGNGGKHTSAQIAVLLDKQKRQCVYCGSDIGSRFHRDHILPLSLGGSNDISNIQLLCPGCNCRKGDMHPEEFAREIGLLI